MGQGGLYVLVFLCLLVVASERTKDDGTRCWAKGKEVTIYPHQCPAEFHGADAKFCCRLCYGANCCQPRKPRVNLARCPRDAQLAGAIRVRRAAPDVVTTAAPEKRCDWSYIVLLLPLSVLCILCVAVRKCCLRCKRFWDRCWNRCYGEEEEGVQTTVNDQSSRDLPRDSLRANVFPDLLRRACSLHVEAPPPYSRLDLDGAQDLPPPYPGPPLIDFEGSCDLPPPYPGEPVVVFRRCRSRVQDDVVAILSGLAAPPEAAVTGGAPGVAASGGAPEKAGFGDAPEEADLPVAAVIGGAPEEADFGDAPQEADLPVAAVIGGAPEEADFGDAPQEADLPVAAVIGGAPQEADLPVAAVIGGAPQEADFGDAPQEADLPVAAVIGGAPEEADLPVAAVIGGAPQEADLPEAAVTGSSEEADFGDAPEEVGLPEAAASGGAPEPPE